MHSILALGLVVLGVASGLPTTAEPPAAVQERPSVAVLGLSAKQGVHADAAELLTENLVQGMRRTRRFSRVTSTSELRAAMAFEAQKQLLQCDSASCVAEVAGALGVDYIVVGSLGRLGETWVFNAKLIRVSNAVAEGAVSEPLDGASEAVLLKAVDPVIASLLKTSNVPPASDPPDQAAAAAPGPADPGAAKPPATRLGAVVSRVVGGLGIASSVASLVLLMGGGVAAGGTWVLFNYVAGFAKYQAPMQAMVILGVVALALGALVLLPSAMVAVAGILASFFLG